jgi:hypothetical protein
MTRVSRGLGGTRRSSLVFKTRQERQEAKDLKKHAKEVARQAKLDRFDVNKMTADERREFAMYGKYGVVRTKDCGDCNGTGDSKCGELCDTCMCGSCAGERHDCGGCDYYSCDNLSDSDDESDGDDSECSEYEQNSDGGDGDDGDGDAE